MRLLRFLLVPMVVLAFAACGRDASSILTVSPTGSTLLVTVARPNVTITNTTSNVVRYFLISPSILAVALYAPCDSTCAAIQPGATVVVPYTNIGGYSPADTEAHLTWWQFGPTPMIRIDSTIQSLRVPLN